MDLLFIVPSDFCLVAHKAKSLPNLSCSLSPACAVWKTPQSAVRRAYKLLTEWDSETLQRSYAGAGRGRWCAGASVFAVEADSTCHSQPTDLTRCQSNHTSWSAMPHTRQTHVGEIMVCLQPDLIPT